MELLPSRRGFRLCDFRARPLFGSPSSVASGRTKDDKPKNGILSSCPDQVAHHPPRRETALIKRRSPIRAMKRGRHVDHSSRIMNELGRFPAFRGCATPGTFARVVVIDGEVDHCPRPH